jgi:biofilm protein TabA
MIFDQFCNVKRYNIPKIDKILDFVAQHDCLVLPNGQINIDSDNLFVKVMEYQPRPAVENRFETHRVYADLQYVVSGIELMQVAPAQVLTSLGKYDSKGDYEFFKADEKISDLVVKAGDFTVYFPTEAHRPSCLFQNFSQIVKKLVFKIKVN